MIFCFVTIFHSILSIRLQTIRHKNTCVCYTMTIVCCLHMFQFRWIEILYTSSTCSHHTHTHTQFDFFSFSFGDYISIGLSEWVKRQYMFILWNCVRPTTHAHLHQCMCDCAWIGCVCIKVCACVSTATMTKRKRKKSRHTHDSSSSRAYNNTYTHTQPKTHCIQLGKLNVTAWRWHWHHLLFGGCRAHTSRMSSLQHEWIKLPPFYIFVDLVAATLRYLFLFQFLFIPSHSLAISVAFPFRSAVLPCNRMNSLYFHETARRSDIHFSVPCFSSHSLLLYLLHSFSPFVRIYIVRPTKPPNFICRRCV